MSSVPLTRSKAKRIWEATLGARPTAKGTHFAVWSPIASIIEVVVEQPAGGHLSGFLQKGSDGVFRRFLPGVKKGDRYRYRIDDKGLFPDPASRFQPDGVHGASEVVQPTSFPWSDSEWKGIDPAELVIYELHVGTFSREGTFDGVRRRLEALRDLGVNCIELMPIADFAGCRSWGYDGVDLFAPAHCYGRPDDLRRLVDEAHRHGIAVMLDVVYNHFGPVGNYALEFSPYYLSHRHSAWAACVNLDEEESDMVNEFFIENALHWVHEYHVDGLRLDATHALHDEKPPHFLELLSDRVHGSVPERRILLIAEDHRNLDRMIRPRWAGGWDLDGVWADDFHHQIRRHVAGDNEGYYRDFVGSTEDIATTLNQGWFYTGEESIHLGESRGTDTVGIPPSRFVICLQNHDQVGNRAFGDRLHHSIDPVVYRAATTLLLAAPQTPMLFMGQEWAASAPFLYFTDHEEDLGKIVTEGRRREFRHFLAFVDPKARETIPDPQAAATFESSRLDWSERDQDPQARTLALHQALLALRRSEPGFRTRDREDYEAIALDESTVLLVRGMKHRNRLFIVVRLSGSGVVSLEDLEPTRQLAGHRWQSLLSTEEPRFSVEPVPPNIEWEGSAPVIQFRRPSALVLKANPLRSGQSAKP